MISVAEAQAKIAQLIIPVGTETVPLADAGGRVLAETVVATRAQPPFAASAMDGYAIQASDLKAGSQLTVTAEIAAGETPNRAVQPGEAIRIFTGAPLPEGADTILIQEDADVVGSSITIRDGFDTANYVRPAGGDFEKGFELTGPRRLSPGDVALLAAMNQPSVQVAKQPIVAVLPTGDELVAPGETPRADQIVASNNYGLKAMLEAQGAEVRLLPIAPDRTEVLKDRLALALDADLIITLGGASVGDHDLVREVAGGAGLDLSFYKIAMRPGKPLMAGKLGGALMLGLPGNPVSSLVCGQIFVLPAIAAMQGLPYQPPATRTAKLTEPIGSNKKREHYMRSTVRRDGEHLICTPADRQDSSLLTVLSDANALMVRQPNDEAQPEGAIVTVMPLPGKDGLFAD